MSRGAIRLSKSRVGAGLQCHKRLWWTVHEPAAPELQPDEALQAVFDEGTRVGAVARAYVPGGVLIDLPYNAYDERIRATEAALQQSTPVIYEASFRASQVFVAVDILESRSEGASVIEVKSTTSVKEQHLPDVAVQAHVVRHNGVEAGGTASRLTAHGDSAGDPSEPTLAGGPSGPALAGAPSVLSSECPGALPGPGDQSDDDACHPSDGGIETGGTGVDPGTTTLPWIRPQPVQVSVVSGFWVEQCGHFQPLAISVLPSDGVRRGDEPGPRRRECRRPPPWDQRP